MVKQNGVFAIEGDGHKKQKNADAAEKEDFGYGQPFLWCALCWQQLARRGELCLHGVSFVVCIMLSIQYQTYFGLGSFLNVKFRVKLMVCCCFFACVGCWRHT